MQDTFSIPSCFTPGEPTADDPTSIAATRSGRSIVASVYRTMIAGHCRLITVTWCRDVRVHGLSISVVEDSDNVDETNMISSKRHSCKVELRPWCFWRKHGWKRFHVEGKPVDVFWDLKSAKFSGEPEPRSDYYVAVVSDDEVVLLLGDLNKEAYRRTGSRPAAIDATLVSRKEHVFGKKRFVARSILSEKGKLHEILIECSNRSSSSSIGRSNMDPEMVIKVDAHVAIHVRHLQWKFRGNQSITVNKARVEVYWDVHDWLFSPGLTHALFIFKPRSLLHSSTSSSPSLMSSFDGKDSDADGSSGFCLFLYAWKLE
ncbi:uncharacterized protein LOC103722827 [Phoenix dactylifera]|uniref:Uncharacterized protein LOC103722827 n=1 Tax=Phoenix dactylifera TaxID=42345 RepID=A0A8B7D2A9_PHODC|nr:uncharacterized protein LOC103722827 [Phoenix dactylifera]